MRKLLLLLAILMVQSVAFGQANLPNNPNAQTVQGPGPSGQEGCPLAVVGAPNGTNVNVNINGSSAFPLNGFVSVVNSTTTPLGINGTFTGQFENVVNFSNIMVYVYVLPSNAQATTNGVRLDWSWDGVTTDFSDVWQVVGTQNSGISPGQNYRTFDFPIRARYVRYSYQNGSTTQTTFHSGLIYRISPTNAALQHGFSQFNTVDNVTNAAVISGSWQPFAVNGQSVLFNNGARTATVTSARYYNYNCRVGIITLNVSSAPVSPGSGGLDVSLQALDAFNASVVINAALPMTSWVTTPGTYRWVFAVGASSTNLSPGIKQVCNYALPYHYVVQVIHHDAQSYTYRASIEFNQ